MCLSLLLQKFTCASRVSEREFYFSRKPSNIPFSVFAFPFPIKSTNIPPLRVLGVANRESHSRVDARTKPIIIRAAPRFVLVIARLITAILCLQREDARNTRNIERIIGFTGP